MSNNALTVENLNKIYSNSKTKKETKALTDLNFKVKEGEVFGLLEPNGAGKTTFLSILGGTVTKTSGNVNVWGFDIDKNPRQVKASIGIVPQEVNLDAFFSPKQLLELQAGLYGIAKRDRITDLILQMVSLEGKANAYSRSLSGGMKRRLLIAKAMVHQPPILILDEPTAGVDVELRNNLWNNVKKLNKYFGKSMDMIVTFSEAVAAEIKRTIKKKILIGFHPVPDKNKFKMPMIISSEAAGKIIYKKLLYSKSFEIIFPKIFCYFMKILKYLPNYFYLKLTSKLSKKL